MTLLIISSEKDTHPWVEALHGVDASVPVQVWPSAELRPQDVQFALCWNHPSGVLAQFKNLCAVSSMGAGIDHLFADTQFPKGVPVARLVDPSLASAMFEYICAAAMYYLRGLDRYRQLQHEVKWQPMAHRAMTSTTIGIMGMGHLGEYSALHLARMGFKVMGWSRTAKHVDGVRSYGESQLQEFASQVDILVCLLPLTQDTLGILNAELFDSLPDHACLINVARGGHLHEADLLAALASGSLRGACLDVFQQEPLPREHAFWAHERIVITPHSSSITDPEAVAPQIIENYRRALKGSTLLNQVDMKRGY